VVTFNNVEQWMQQIDQHATTDCEKLLLATKCDKETKFNMTFFETSAQTGLGVNEAFEHIAKSIKNKQTPGGPKRGFLNSRTNQV
jgi:Ras-related protein Rab-8A